MDHPHEQCSDALDPEFDILLGVTSLRRWDKAPAPTTRLPPLDIFAHDSGPPVRRATGGARIFSVPCNSKQSSGNDPQGHPQVVLRHLQRYACFIIGLTGQDAVSIWCEIRTISRSWRGMIVAERPLDCGGQCDLQVVNDRASTPGADVTDFSFHLGSVADSREWSSAHGLSIMAVGGIEFHIQVSGYGIPEAAIKSLLDQIQLQLAGLEDSTESSSNASVSILTRPTTEGRLRPGLSSSTSLLHEMFELQAKQTPDRCAIEFLHAEYPRGSSNRLQNLSYKELSDKCGSLAKDLQAIFNTDNRRHSHNSIVPVFLSTSPELYISYLAILNAGYAFCPLPTDAPSQRLKEILDDIQPLVVLGVGPEPEDGPWYEVSCSFNFTWLDIQRCSQNSHITSPSQLKPSNLAYLMYTSGSTGKPKGVQITHHAAAASIVAHMEQYQETMPHKVPMRWYQFAAPTFDPSIMEIFVTLCYGGTLCSAPREMTLSSPEAAITETKSTIMMATPGFASILNIDRLPTLRCLWTMGETLSRKVIDRFAEGDVHSSRAIATDETFRPSMRLCNAYGPTEAAVNATFFPNVHPDTRGSIIGYPLGTSLILVIDPKSSEIRPLPLAFVGELAVAGSQVSVGYLQQPNANSTAFIDDERYGRLYRTGDRARIIWDTKGIQLLEYLGRFSDDQVKINGQRVELGEIESVLCTIPEVREAVAVVKNLDQNGGSGLLIIACLVLERTAKLSLESIREKCKANIASKLPPHMQPARLLFVSQLPQTLAGKVDRTEILRIASKQPASWKMFARPCQDTEREIRSPEQEGTNLLPSLESALQKTIGISSSAAEHLKYGLDSLSTLRFLRNIKKQGIDVLSLKDILHARSVRDLAQVASGRSQGPRLSVDSEGRYSPASLRGRLDSFRARWQVAVQQNMKLTAEDVQGILPTTATQTRILLSFSKSIVEPTKQRNYVHHSIHNFARETDVRELKATWCKVLKRHDIYRTVFMPVDDDLSPFAQAILSPDSPLSHIRWIERSSTLPDVNLENADIISAAREAESIIKLTTPALVLTLVKTENHLSVLLSMLHALFDLGSLHLLLEEIAAEIEGRPPLFRNELRLAVEEHFASQDTETNVFWNDYMYFYEPSPFPSLTSVRSEMTLESTSISQIESALTMDQLEKRSRDLLCSSLAALQAAWAAILLAYTSSTSSDVAFGTVFADRADNGRDFCIAPTFSVVPTRTRSGDSSLNIDILRTLTDDNSRANHHLHPSLHNQTPNVQPYDTTIALQVFQDIDGRENLWQNTLLLPMAHDYAVMVEATPNVKGQIYLKATYTDTYLDQKSAEMMLSQLDEIVIWILANPMLPYRSALNSLKADKLSHLNSNPRMEPAAESSLLHTQFELNTREHPDRIALEYLYSLQDTPGNIKRWSYRELNIRANELVGSIRSKFGDVTGTVIPILMDKQPELYIAVLGVLKAGAAWSPIDTSSPVQRRQGLIARVCAKLILVSQDAIVDKAGIPEGVGIVTVATESRTDDNHSSAEPSHGQHATPNSLAYLIWTSGTTGAPKGVPISHRAGCTSMKALQANIPCRAKSGAPARCLQFSQHTFDVFVQDLFFTWGAGGVVISASREIMTTSFAELSRRTEATHAHLTPAFAATVRRDSCQHLEVITMIGEKLPQHVADNWGRNVKAYNTYGPAEATVVSTMGEFSGSGNCIKSSNIGRPLPSVSCYVLRDGKEVMVHGIGELALGGPQLATGYLNDSEKTSSKFVKYGNPERALYLTGDIVRQLADGSLDFIGREDDLVKLGGIRVELSEISFAMKDCHRLANQVETCYISRSDRPSKVVVSFIAANVEYMTMDNGRSICTPESVDIAKCAMSQAQKNLPNSMVPSTVVILQKIPTTSSAKVDRKVLQKAFEDLDLESWEAATRAGQLKGSDEEGQAGNGLRIRQCLSEFSNAPLQTIHLYSSLHSLGIDSLSAPRLVQRLMDWDISLSIADILQSQAVNDILRILQTNDSKTTAESNPMVPAEEFSKAWLPRVQSHVDQQATFVMPTTPLQEGVLGESMLNKSSYWSNHFFELTPSIAINCLHSAWELVSRETEALRTCFLTTAEVYRADQLPPCPSSFLQTVLDGSKLDWAEIVVERNLHDTAQERAARIASHHQNFAFHQPPWAVTIIQTGTAKQMMLTIHHAIHDAESINFIISGVAAAYQRSTVPTRHQIRCALPACITYNGKESDEVYWHNILGPYADVGLPPWPDLIGTDESIKKKVPKTMISECLELRLDSEDIARATRSLEIGFSVILKVAFGCLLLDYLETTDVVFAEILSQRFRNLRCRDAVGPLVASIPVPFTTKQTAMELLSEQSDRTARSRSHGSPSGPLVRKILRRSQQQALYPAVFVFHPSEERAEGEQLSQIELWRPGEDHLGLSVEHDLALNIYPKDGWMVELTVSDYLMNEDSLKTFCRQFQALTQAILRSPSQPLVGLLDNADCSILSISESRLPEPKDHPCNLNPMYWLQYHAQHHPDWNAAEVATNVGFGNTEAKCWSFRTLFHESRKIARFLHERDCKGEIVAVCTARTLQSYAIIVGILMSGNTYLPIDDGLPQQRKTLLLEDSNCALLFTDKACVREFGNAPSNCSIIDIDDTSTVQELQKTSDSPCQPPSPHESAYLLYTSGSTGKPKGVLVSHRSLCGFIGGLTHFMGQCSTRAQSQAGVGKWLGLASRAFDVHLAEMFLAWRSGLTAVTAPRELLLDDLRLALTSLKVTHACFVPSLLEQAELTPDQIPDFVFMTIGGEKLSKRVVDTWAGNPRITAVNAYGPTELAIGCSASHIVPNFNVSNIGQPYGNTVAHVLIPETLHYAKKGQAGELCFTGCLVGNGYLNRPDAKGFVEDFLGQRMYRTGDMARMLTDGSLVYLGRSDDQTKLRGQRMELSEISESIRTSSRDDLEVVTLLVDHPELPSTFLTSFVSDLVERAQRYDAKPALVDKRLGVFTTQIKEQCRRTLPAYMIPDYVIPVDVIPLARISGKVDVKTLKASFASLSLPKLLGTIGGESPDTIQRELTSSEHRIAAVVKGVLNIENQHSIQTSTNLFALGLDSLNAVGLTVKLREIGLQCSLAFLLGNPTIESIATRADYVSIDSPHSQPSGDKNGFRALEDEVLAQNDLRISKDEVKKVLPCLPVQESTVTATLNSEGPTSYINHIVFELDRGIDIYRFKNAWLELIKDTPILRTVFYYHRDSFVQLVLRPEIVQLPWKILNADRESSARDLLSDLVEEISHDISNTIQERPALRFHLVKTTIGCHLFSVTIHHALYDGQSFDLMMEDLWLRYSNQMARHRTALETLLEYRAAQDIALQESFWSHYLAESRPTRIRDDKMTEDDPSATINQSLKLNLSNIRHLANKLEVTLATLAQCLFAIIFARRMKRSDVLFGSVLSGRSVPVQGADSIVAPCITTIPQRIQFQLDEILSQLLRRVQDTSTKCLEYQHTSLRDICRWAHLEQPMFEALFSFTYKEAPKQDIPPWVQVKSSMFLGCPLAVEFTADNSSDALAVTFGYTEAFGSEKDANGFIEDMEILLIMICNGEDPAISELGIAEETSARISNVKLWDETRWSSEEETIREELRDFTGIDPIRITKNTSFFHLGVDSISALRLAKNLRRKGLSVSSADIMRHPSTGNLGHYLSSNQSQLSSRKGDSDDANDQASLLALLQNKLNVAADSIKAIYCCTPLQAGMIMATLASHGDAYVHKHARVLPAEVNIDRLRDAWAMTVQSLDILRTSFHYTDDNGPQWIACVHDKMTTTHLDCSDSRLPSPTVPPLILQQEEDLEKPPFQANFSDDGKRKVFQLTLHHALYDGISLPMIFERFSLAYRSGSLEVSQTPSFYDAAQLISKSNSQSTDFWLAPLKGYRNFNMHKASDDAPHQISATRKCTMSPETALDKCKFFGVTLQTVLLAAYSKVWAIILGRRDIAFGHVVSGRSLPKVDCEKIVGPLFNTVPFRFRLDHLLSSNQDMMDAIQDFTTKAQAHQHASLTQVQEEWRKREGCGEARLFNSLFLFQKVASAAHDDFTSSIEDESQPTASEYCLNVEVEQNETDLVLSASCHEGCLKDRSLEDCLDMYEEVLQNLFDNPVRAIGAHPEGLSELPLEVPKTELNRLLVNYESSDSTLLKIKAVLAKISEIPVENIASTASIFALGLTSLSAITVAAECRRQGLQLSVADVLQGVTAKGIYHRLTRRSEHKDETTETSETRIQIRYSDLLNPPVREECVESVLPALSGQTYHLSCWLRSGRTMYMPTWSFACPKLDIKTFQRAWALLRERHPILRTTFSALTSTKAAQLVLKPSSIDESSFSCISGTVDIPSVQQFVREQQRQPTDIKTPPVRLRVVQGPTQDVMLLTIHHALYDAWSLPIILSDLAKLYKGTTLKPPPNWQHYIEHTAMNLQPQNAPTFWRKTLHPFEPTLIIRPHPSTPKSTPQTFISLPHLLTNIPLLTSHSRTNNTTLPTLLLLSLARSLTTLTNTTSPTLGLFTLGRSASFPNIAQIAGPCLNMLPLVVRSPWEEPWYAKAQEIQRGLADRVPFEQDSLAEVLGWVRGGVEKDGKGGRGMKFNVYVNILWGVEDEGVVHSDRDKEKSGQEEEGEGYHGLFKRLDVGVPSDFASEKGFFGGGEEKGKTGLEALNWPACGGGVGEGVGGDEGGGEEGAVFVDIFLEKGGGSVGIGARIEGGVIGEEEVEEWLRGVGEGVGRMLGV